MPRAKDVLEILLFFLLTFVLYLLFLANMPFFWESRGGLPLSELSDYSDRRLIPLVVFSSGVVCALLGSLMMEWAPFLKAGTLTAYWATTFLLIWIDGAPALSWPSHPFFYLGTLALGALFLGLFFFNLEVLRQRWAGEKGKPKEAGGFKAAFVPYWLGTWMSFYFLVSVLVILHAADDPEDPLPLAVGFCALSFLNFTLLLRCPGVGKINRLFSIGGILYGLWVLFLLWFGWGMKWLH